MKKTVAILTLALITVFSSAALAQNQNQNQDQAAFRGQWQEHRTSMSAIQDKLWAKSMEYDALIANPNSKQADISAVINEMTALRAQLRTEGDKFRNDMYDQGFDRDGRGYGYGGGMGYGYGCGGMGGGYGDGMGRGYGRHHRGGGHRNW